jgi:hypothetical protein
MNIHIDTKRFDGAIERAQNRLDEHVLGDCTEYVPFLGGQLRSSGHIVEPGIIEWNTPYAHYQYAGELYLTEDGRSYAEKYEKKNPTGIPLHYNEPGTGDHWFERAKQEHGKQWIDLVKREVGRG